MTTGFVIINRADVAGFDGALVAVWYKLNDLALWAAGTRTVGGVAYELSRGQLAITVPAFADDLGFGRQVVRRCLASLEKMGRISTSTRPRRATVITVKGYGERVFLSSPTSGSPQNTNPNQLQQSAPTRNPESLDGQGFGVGAESDKAVITFEATQQPTQHPTQGTNPQTLEPQGSQAVEKSGQPSSQPSSQPTNFEPTQHPTQGTNPQTLEPQGSQAVEKSGQPSSQPRVRIREKEEREEKTFPPLSPRSTTGGGGGQKGLPDFSPAEAEMIDYAEQRLNRVAGPMERVSFAETWRANPRVTADRLRSSIDWLASHPMALRDTKSITRAFYEKQARQEYTIWDRQLVAAVTEALRSGRSADEIVEDIVERTPSFEAAVMRAYTTRIVGLCRPVAR